MASEYKTAIIAVVCVVVGFVLRDAMQVGNPQGAPPSHNNGHANPLPPPTLGTNDVVATCPPPVVVEAQQQPPAAPTASSISSNAAPSDAAASPWMFDMDMLQAITKTNHISDKIKPHGYEHFYMAQFAQLSYFWQHTMPPQMTQQKLDEPVRQRKFRLLEIGPGEGGSYVQFKHMFGDRIEYQAVDIRGCGDAFKRWRGTDTYEEICSKVKRGDQCSDAGVEKLSQEMGMFDVIIDDAAHRDSCMIKTFEKLFVNNLNPGGLFIVEDIAFTVNPKSHYRQLLTDDRRTNLGYVPSVHGLITDIQMHQLQRYQNSNWKNINEGFNVDAEYKFSVPFYDTIQSVSCAREICGIWKATTGAFPPM